jgi:alpha-tubulin suppressor-like RCC1 family protein
MGDDLPTVDLGTGRTVVDVSAGGNHTCAILDDGTVKCWGIRGVLGSTELFNHWGDEPQEMGDDLPPVELGTGRTAVHIVSGNTHNCALLDNGTVKCWGYNAYGQLGLGDTFNRPNPDVPTMGMGDELPAVDLGDGRTAVSIAAGFDHTCALLDDETVKCWGSNSNGQLGMGDSDDRGDAENEMGDALPAVDLGTDAVASDVHVGGGFFSCALLTNGTLKCWGSNSYGALGIGDYYNRGDDPNEMGDDLPPVMLTF